MPASKSHFNHYGNIIKIIAADVMHLCGKRLWACFSEISMNINIYYLMSYTEKEGKIKSVGD